jgi:hypothetical protein
LGALETIVSNDDFLIQETDLASFTLPSLITADGFISFQSNSSLQSVSMPLLTYARNISFSNNPSLIGPLFLPELKEGKVSLEGSGYTSVDLPKFAKGGFNLYATAFTTFSLPALMEASDISIAENPDLDAVNFPVLKTSTGVISFHLNALNAISAPQLMDAAQIEITYNFFLTTFSMPQLATVSYLYLLNNDNLASLSFPSLASISGTSSDSGISIKNHGSLTALSFPALMQYEPLYFDVSFNKLPSAQINGILANLVQITPPLKFKTITLEQGGLGSPPTGQGITDRTTLEFNMNTVTADM